MFLDQAGQGLVMSKSAKCTTELPCLGPVGHDVAQLYFSTPTKAREGSSCSLQERFLARI